MNNKLMKIIFDLSFIIDSYNKGVNKYAYRILEHIIHKGEQSKYILLVNVYAEDELRRRYPNFEMVVIGKKWMEYTKFFKFFFYGWSFQHAVNKMDGNVVFCPFGHTINCWKINKKKITTIHDLQVRIDPEDRPKREVMRQIWAENKMVKTSSKIVTISEFSKNQILFYYPNTENKVFNLGNSVSMETNGLCEPMDIGKRYLLYVGRLDPKKNILTLLKAFCIIADRYPELMLVLVTNKWDYYNDHLKFYVDGNSLNNRVKIVKDCTEKELSQWYLGASMLIFPSLREGFGFPPLEAAYMKVPVISTKCDSLYEVTMGLLNYYEPPLNENCLAEKIVQVLENPPSDVEMEYIKSEFVKHYSIDVVGERICNFLEAENGK